jgi:hypothetical protein
MASERPCRPAQAGANCNNITQNISWDEMHIAGQKVERRRLRPCAFGGGDRGGELWPAIQWIGALAGFDFNERVDNPAPFGFGEA